ncbi:MAG: polysaccharide biosynthesis/export family protein [Phycisphaeraceae bacterium]|nr:polysaccharide biosynthesis/export family protein [Phycisphaeraceae bacterium]
MKRHDRLNRLLLGIMATAMLLLIGGCEMDSFMDPSVVGRWERTPVKMPILDRLDVIEGDVSTSLTVTQVRPEDLIPDTAEYVIGVGDAVQINIFELIVPGQDAVQQRRVDETGVIRLQLVGPVQAEGLSPSQLEDEIAKALEDKGILRQPTVSVIMLQTQQNTFSIMGEPTYGGTSVGTYPIPRPDFRLYDALAMARGISGRTKKLVIIRQVPLDAAVAGQVRQQLPSTSEPQAPQTAPDASQLIDQLDQVIQGDQEPAQKPAESAAQQAPKSIQSGLEQPGGGGGWVYVGGKWVPVTEAPAGQNGATEDEFKALITQRLIEVPYQKLLEGDMRYNIVIRPGDIIRVPDPSAGFVYIGGQISRPGTYNVPGETELTITQLVLSAGGLNGLAIPERVDIRRRTGDSEEAIMRFDLRAIFEGEAPNFFLKPNDEINVGTNFIATPLAVFRNGLRTTYGFGFVLDRNWGTDVFPLP